MGANPSFNARAKIRRDVEMGSEKGLIIHSPVIHALITAENKIIAAAAACTIKYLVVASAARGWWV